MIKPTPRRGRPGHDRWLVSYADFITLLFGFFVVLYAFARADQKKQAQIPAAIDSAFHAMGLFSGKEKNVGNGDESASAPARFVTAEQIHAPSEIKHDLERIQRELTQKFADAVAAHTIAITMSRDGLVVSLREAGFFDSGSAMPKRDAFVDLHQIADSLGREPYDIRVEGHTDNVPIHNATFDSNWELSAARATAIARLFLEWRAVAPERISAAGYGEFHPVAANDSADGRAKNRRVDLLVMPRTEINFVAPNEPMQQGPWVRITAGDAPANESDFPPE